MHKMFTAVLVFILTMAFFTTGFAQTPEESLKKAFPDIKVDGIQPLNIKGLYEVVSGGRILYYSPETDTIILGQIFTKDGRSLTRERQQEIAANLIKAKMKDVPLNKSVSIGKGKHVIIEITDPDCPYCRKASEFFSKRTDTTRHVFFYPLPSHPKAKDKVLYIFCAEDRAKAYEEVMSGKLDKMDFKPCENSQANELLKTHKGVADLLGITGTPFFFVDGQAAIFGADMPQLEKLLRNGK